MKKVTLQDIADSLEISRTSVWKVFSGHEGVSTDLRNRVIAKAQELNYNLPQELLQSLPNQTASKVLNVSVATCRPETSLFWMTIIHEIAKELSLNNVNLIYTYLPSVIEEDYELPQQLSNGTTHGIIVMNVYNENLLQLISKLSIPKVFMDTATNFPFSDLNGDLILSEGKTCIEKLTEHLIGQGKKDLGFIGDINYALTNFQRYEGFTAALSNYNLSSKPEHSFIGSIGIDSYENEIEFYLSKLSSMPDAFVCVSDYVACLVWKCLTEMGYHLPEDIIITGFDGNTELSVSANFPTVQVYNRDLGFRAATQILYRIKNPKVRFETIYMSSELVLSC